MKTQHLLLNFSFPYSIICTSSSLIEGSHFIISSFQVNLSEAGHITNNGQSYLNKYATPSA